MQSLVKKVKGQVRFVRVLEEYTNGLLTTGGFYQTDDLEDTDQNLIVSVTYDSNACTELPINWPDLLVLDDNNKRQKIKQIDFDIKDEGPVYLMEDDTRSWEVTL